MCMCVYQLQMFVLPFLHLCLFSPPSFSSFHFVVTMVKSSTLALTLLKQLSLSIRNTLSFPISALGLSLPPSRLHIEFFLCLLHKYSMFPVISTPGHPDTDILSRPYLFRFLFLSPFSLTYLSFHTGHCVCNLVGTMLFYTKMSLHLPSLVNVCDALSLPDGGWGGRAHLLSGQFAITASVFSVLWPVLVPDVYV